MGRETLCCVSVATILVTFGEAALGASVILNEYNAVSTRNYLDDNEYGGSEKQDPFFASVPGMPDGRIQGNGGNWIELVVTDDHVDMRGYELRWAELGSPTGTHDIWTGDETIDQGIIAFGTAETWADLRAGTIITVSELESIPVDTTMLFPNRNFTFPPDSDDSFEVTIDLSTDTSYDPDANDWWIHVSTLDELDSSEPLVTTVTNVPMDNPGNFSVGNSDWQLTIVDGDNHVVFGPAGEGIGLMRGLSNDEVGKLEAAPSPDVDPLTAAYKDGTSSTFGAPNIWGGGTNTQDFRGLRGASELRAGDADQNMEFDQLDLVQVQVAAKYLTGEPATWGEGDWNGAPGGYSGSPPPGDGRFDQQDIVAALQAGVYLTGPYSSRTGNLGSTSVPSSIAEVGSLAYVPIPEPPTCALLVAGLLALLGFANVRPKPSVLGHA